MDMMIQKERLIDLLEHPDARVRREAAEALERFFSGAEDVMKPLLRAIRAYPDSLLMLGSRIRAFVPDDEDMQTLVEWFLNPVGSDEIETYSMRGHLLAGFLAFPNAVLAPHRAALEQDADFTRMMANLHPPVDFSGRSAEELWEELADLCAGWDPDDIDPQEQQYADMLVDELARQHPGNTAEYVTDLLNDETSEEYVLQDYAVPLAGDLKLEAAIPGLFRILRESDFLALVHESCIAALGRIGTPAVLDGIREQYEHEDLRSALAGILGYMPYPYAEDFGIEMLAQESDPEITTFWAISLCDIFSLKAADAICDVVREQAYSPEIDSLLEALRPVYAYHKRDVDLADLERADKAFAEEYFENSPLHALRDSIFQRIDELADREDWDESEQEDDPEREPRQAPSHKKGKAAKKRAKKKKKKKRK